MSPEGKTEVLCSGKAHRVHVKGTEPSYLTFNCGGTQEKKVAALPTHAVAAELVVDFLNRHDLQVDYIGHRFVHGGHLFSGTALVGPSEVDMLKQCISLAPIHNQVALDVILESRKRLPKAKHYVVFDTAFHKTIPPYAYTYPLPKAILKRFGFRKYGFHGLSYSYVVRSVNEYLCSSAEHSRIVACHLGTGGSSVAAIKNLQSVDTSMGYSPLTGLVMSTRCGDIDPMLAVYLMVAYDYRPDLLEDLLNEESGLLGISGFSSDIRDIIRRFNEDESEEAELAIRMYVYRIKKFIGSFVALLGGIDLLIFTDDIGLHNWYIRQKVCKGLEWCSVVIDDNLNHDATGDRICHINERNSSAQILIAPNDEELVICLEGIRLLKDENHITV